ncbi:hypothetical protein ANRL1_04732 [Anaerolineae bacterium]|nr:hypothetical protein ANRL1_04732 [Anaerolineae bacterium]
MPIFKPNIAALKAKHDLAGLLQALKDKDAKTRREAIVACGDLGTRSLAPALVEILLADNPGIAEKADAVEALGKIGDESVMDVLVQANALSKERERDLIEAATTSPDRRYHEGFYITRIATDEFMFRSTIASAIARFGGMRALEALFDMLATENGHMANNIKSAIQTAITNVLRKGDAESVARLAGKLKHSSEDVRQWAAQCLGEFGDARVADTLIEVASNEEEPFLVRQAALMSLSQIGDRRTLPFLEDLQKAGNRGLARDAEMCAIQIRQRYPIAPQI